MRWNSSMISGLLGPFGCGAARAFYHGILGMRGASRSVDHFRRRDGALLLGHDGFVLLLFRSLGCLGWRLFGRIVSLLRGYRGLLRRRRRWRRIGQLLLLLAQCREFGFEL